MRWIGILFNTYISNKLGAEGIGIYSLVQSVFGFAVTFACSGVNLGTVRMVSEALAGNCYGDVRTALKKCVYYSLFFSSISMLFLLFGANFIGIKLVKDIRTVKSIRFLAVSLPFISLSSVFNGYYYAVRRVYKNSFISIFEEGFQIAITVKILSLFMLKGIEYACVAVALGTLFSEILSLSVNYIIFSLDLKKHIKKTEKTSLGLGKKLISISLPLALSSYARSGLVTIEHLLIPIGLRKYGASFSESMSVYGLIHGMVFPIIMFPSCIVYSLAGLLVPELARFNENMQKNKIDSTVTTVLKYTLIYSIGVAGILICFAYELSITIYNSTEAYTYIRLFAPLVSVMYLDAAVDGMLKGLNEQIYSMKINIADASMSVLFVYFLVPRLGVRGYIISIFVCEIFNCGLSLTRLIKICDPQISLFKCIFKPVICVIISTITITYMFEITNLTVLTGGQNLFLRIFLTVCLYLIINFTKTKRKKIASSM